MSKGRRLPINPLQWRCWGILDLSRGPRVLELPARSPPHQRGRGRGRQSTLQERPELSGKGEWRVDGRCGRGAREIGASGSGFDQSPTSQLRTSPGASLSRARCVQATIAVFAGPRPPLRGSPTLLDSTPPSAARLYWRNPRPKLAPRPAAQPGDATTRFPGGLVRQLRANRQTPDESRVGSCGPDARAAQVPLLPSLSPRNTDPEKPRSRHPAAHQKVASP